MTVSVSPSIVQVEVTIASWPDNPNDPTTLSVPGLKVGDILISSLDITSSPVIGAGGYFEYIVSVADQLQQNGYSDNAQAGHTALLMFFRPAS